MRNKDKKDPSKLKELSVYSFNGKVIDVIKMLEEIVKQHPGATIQGEFDYSGCYYESDTPSYNFIVRSK